MYISNETWHTMLPGLVTADCVPFQPITPLNILNTINTLEAVWGIKYHRCVYFTQWNSNYIFIFYNNFGFGTSIYVYLFLYLWN